jgi:hypothetical protein
VSEDELSMNRPTATLTTSYWGMDDDRPPICPVCGVTMVPAALSARESRRGEWICLECEETAETDEDR